MCKISKEQFEELNNNYKNYASWLIYPDNSESLYNEDIFNCKENPNLLNQLHSDVFLAAFNSTRETPNWKAFHCDNTNDDRIKKIVTNFSFLKGCYITDCIKGCYGPNIREIKQELRKKPDVKTECGKILLNEIKILNPKVILAIGRESERFLNKIKNEMEQNIPIKYVPHYSRANPYFKEGNYNGVLDETSKNIKR